MERLYELAAGPEYGHADGCVWPMKICSGHDRPAVPTAGADAGREMVRRLADLGYTGEAHTGPCAGLLGRCPDCVALYRAVVGDERPICLVCGGEHFAYEPHWAPDASGAVLGEESGA